MVSVDKEKCIGCGACAASCPAVFEMQDTDSGHKAVVKSSQKDSKESCVKEAEESCPVQAIH